MGIFPKVRGENKKYLKPPPSYSRKMRDRITEDRRIFRLMFKARLKLLLMVEIRRENHLGWC